MRGFVAVAWRSIAVATSKSYFASSVSTLASSKAFIGRVVQASLQAWRQVINPSWRQPESPCLSLAFKMGIELAAVEELPCYQLSHQKEPMRLKQVQSFWHLPQLQGYPFLLRHLKHPQLCCPTTEEPNSP